MSSSSSNNKSNAFDLVSANAIVAQTAMPIDVGRKELTFDPVIGEAATLSCKAALLGIDATVVQPPNFDPIAGAVAAVALADHCESERFGPTFAKLHPDFLGDASPTFLRTLAQTVFYLETRARTRGATNSDVRVDPALVAEGIALRDSMLIVLGYHFQKDQDMQAELAQIRQESGYTDLASDLARVATHYTQHASALAEDKKFYNAADQERARGISNEILAALKTTGDNTIVDLRNRAWTKMTRVYARLKAAADFMFAESAIDLALFPALRQAVVAQPTRKKPTDGEVAQPVAPVAPVPPVSPTPAPAPNPGTGPGGNPLI